MKTLSDNSIAGMCITVRWKSDDVRHDEHYFADDVNMWRDIFPDPVRQELLGKFPGDTINHRIAANDIINKPHIPPVTLPLSKWRPPSANSVFPRPLTGRYYPQGFLHDMPGIYSQTLTPMRVTGVDGESVTVDMNHPLDGRDLDIQIEVGDISQTSKERGGRCSDRLLDALDDGPGLQARRASSPITYDPVSSYQRNNSDKDSAFYSEPRLVSHIDSLASEHLASVCDKILFPGAKVLDLMASVDSHLPKTRGLEVTGLGMNMKEMIANTDLNSHFIHDLNEDPDIPFPDSLFDAVLCNLSIEYLIDPGKVIRGIARVLKPSGRLLISFSNRWFPPKVIRLWTELHDFERMGYALQLSWPYFKDLQTYSFRNWPRPVADRYYPGLMISDPVYVVTGTVRPLSSKS